MSRPTYATIDSRAFVANYRHAKALAPRSRAVAVVKANAYGHGAVALARALADQADAFGVACSEEAMELRESGIDNPIVLLEGVFDPAELANAALHDLAVAVHSSQQIEWLLDARLAHPLQVWLKVDTGMHRLGLAPSALNEAHARLRASRNVSDLVLMSHFARADETGSTTTAEQLMRFRSACGTIQAPASLANSAAIMAWPDTHAEWIRPGLMLYGVAPLDDPAAAAALTPVMHLESRVIAVHQLAAGDAVGYGGRFVCDRPTRIGVVAIGYADGYPRHAPDGTPVAVNGQRVALAGRVSMDMITVDLSDQPHAQVGDRVQLWGDQVSAVEVATLSGTIAYELFTRVNRRVHIRQR